MCVCLSDGFNLLSSSGIRLVQLALQVGIVVFAENKESIMYRTVQELLFICVLYIY